MKARKGKPIEVQELEGFPGKRRPKPGTVPEPRRGRPTIPPAVRDDPVALRHWEYAVGELEAMRVLSKADQGALTGFAVAMGALEQAQEHIRAHGQVFEAPITTGKGDDKKVIGYQWEKNPAVTVRDAALREIRSYLAELGLGPAARSRLRITPDPDGDTLQEFLQKGQAADAPEEKPN